MLRDKWTKQQRPGAEGRRLDNADARDMLDRSIEQLREKARKIKRHPNGARNLGVLSCNTDHPDEFQDIGVFACSLRSVIDALEEYERLAKPAPSGSLPLKELNFALHMAYLLGAVMEPLPEALKQWDKMVALRGKKSVKAHRKNKKITELARKLWDKRTQPYKSTRALTLDVLKSVAKNPELVPNLCTAEELDEDPELKKKFSAVQQVLSPFFKMWKTEQKSTSA